MMVIVISKFKWIYAALCSGTAILVLVAHISGKLQTHSNNVGKPPRTTLARESGYATNACFSADGKKFLAVFGNSEVIVWSTRDWQCAEKLDLTSDCVDYSFSPDAQILAVRSLKHKNLITIWNISLGHRCCTLQLPKITVETNIFFVNNSILAVQNVPTSSSFWNVRTGKEIFVNITSARNELTNHSAQYIPLYQFDQNKIIVTDKLTGHIIHLFKHSSVVYSVAISADEAKLAAGSREDGAMVWDIKTGKTLYTVNSPKYILDDTNQYEILSVAFSHDGKTLATGDQHGNIQFWDATTGQKKATLQSEGPVTELVFSPQDKILAICHGLGRIQIWDTSLQ